MRPTTHPRRPIALTIAGSDSGGGAGIQADLKTFAALGVHGASVVTCLTAQNPKRILGLQPCEPRFVRQQLSAVFEELPPKAIKTGMLYSAEIIREVVGFLSTHKKKPPLIVDPVSIATSGTPLLQPGAVDVLRYDLLPMAALVTPNLSEAETLAGIEISEPEDMRHAAQIIWKQSRCAVLVKGGHLKRAREAVDIFYDGKNELMLTAPFIQKVSLHGTGCTYSAAIAGFLARGFALPEAVGHAKTYITEAIAQYSRAGKHPVLSSPYFP